MRRAAGSMTPVRVGSGVGREDRIMMNRTLRLANGRHWTIRHTNPCPPDDEVVGVAHDFISNQMVWEALRPRGVRYRRIDALTQDDPEGALLDAQATPVDVLVYGGGRYPGVTPHPGVSASGHSLERRPAIYDTDDCSHDFFDRNPPDPGSVHRQPNTRPFSNAAQ